MRFTSIALACTLFYTACKKNTVTINNNYSQADAFKKAEINYLKNYKNAILGEWKIDSIHMKLGLIQLPNSKDTMIYNYGNLIINALNPDQIDSAKLNNLQGYIVANNNDKIPIQSRLFGLSDNSHIDSIKSVFGAVESDYHIENKTPFDKLPITYQFLSDYMLGDNFNMYLDASKTKLIWKGSRFIVQINLTKTR